MKFKFGIKSLRTRLIVAYLGLIILGFGFVAGIAGQQVSEAVRDEYERQYRNNAEIVSEALERLVFSYYVGDVTSDEFEDVVSQYEEETGAQIEIFIIIEEQQAPSEPSQFDDGRPPKPSDQLPDELKQFSEVESASRNEVIIDRREDDSGVMMLYTAAPIDSRQGRLGYVQLRIPASDLNQEIYNRWALLALSVIVVTLVALLASTWLSISLIKPLATLENFARQLADGNLSHRVPELGTTELDEVGHSFNEMATQLEAMIEEQRAFASNTSHELRTPLTTMRLRTEALLHDSDLEDGERQQYIEELDTELIRMSSLIQDLILLSRFDAGRASLGQEEIDFFRFAQSTTNYLQAKAEEKEIKLSVNIPDGQSASVQGSLNHLSIVFRNIVDNALKYTPDGGQIIWDVQTDDNWIINTISDTGQGIETDHIEHIFDRFYREDKARSRKIQGTGLGLSLVKAIVDIYKAEISVSSEGKDQGTTIIIKWPKMKRAVV